MKAFKIFFLSLLGMTLLILISGISIMFIYRDDVKTRIISEINKRLRTEIIVKSIDFSVFSKFPFASIELTDAVIMDVDLLQKDTLLKSKSIFLQFNLMDIIKENYKIKRLDIADAFLRIKIDSLGKDNFHFWQTIEGDAVNVPFKISLEKIYFEKARFSLVDNQKKQNYDFTAEDISFRGKFSEKDYSLKIIGKLFFKQLESRKVVYLKKKRLAFSLDMDVKDYRDYAIKESSIKLEDLEFKISGKIFHDSLKQEIDLKIKGSNMDILSLVSLLPEKQQKPLKKFNSEGIINFTAQIKGSYFGNNLPLVTSEFGIEKGNLTSPEHKYALRSIYLKGSFNSGNQMSREILTINKFSARFGNGEIHSSFVIYNFNKPSIEIDLNGQLDVDALNQIILSDTLNFGDGSVLFDLHFDGKIKDQNKYISEDIRKMNLAGNIKTRGISFNIKDNPLSFKSINSDLDFKNNDVTVNNLEGNISSSDFKIKGYFRNLLGYLMLKENDLGIIAELQSDEINFDELLKKDKESIADSGYKITFNDQIDFEYDFEIKKINFQKFDGRNVKGKILMKDRRILISDINLEAMDGIINGNAIIIPDDSSNLKISYEGNLVNLNINKVFYQFENFGQGTIKDDHLKGILTSFVSFSGTWSSELVNDPKTIFLQADFAIDKGELIGFQPMQKLSRFLEVSELEHIRFSKLQNSIQIKDEMINFPSMTINSNAINLNFSGTHDFNNEIDYKIKVQLNEVLGKKARQKKENEEFGEVIDEETEHKLNLFLTMKGNISDPKIAYDMAAGRKQFKENLKAEKQELKSILKDEFGWFKSDTTLNQNKKSREYNFGIEWDENEEKKNEKKETKPVEKSKTGKLIEKITESNKEEYESSEDFE